MSGMLDMSVCVEKDYVSSNYSPKLWGMVSLADSSISNAPLRLDLIIALDISASMRVGDKFANVKKAISTLLDRMDRHQSDSRQIHHTISLVAFNDSVEFAYPFLACTPDNKRLIFSRLDSVRPYGVTNLVGALKSIVKMIEQRNQRDLTAIILFSDGDYGLDMPSDQKVKCVREIPIPKNCVCHVFGMGIETNPLVMCSIANHFSGVFYFVEKMEMMSELADGCLTDVLNVRIRDLKLTLGCHDGCRLIKINTVYKVKEERPSKTYSVAMGLISLKEKQVVVFQLSLRQLNAAFTAHSLLCVEADYLLPDGRREITTKKISVIRVPTPHVCAPVPDLQYHLQRIVTSNAILEALQKTTDLDKILDTAIKSLSDQKMIQDLLMCKVSSPSRLHIMYSFLSSYLTEKALDLKRMMTANRMSYTIYVDV